MMFNKLILLPCALILAFSAQTTQAETVYRVGAEATVNKDQVVQSDLYISSGLLDRTYIAGEVKGDVYTAGSAVVLDGPVGADVFAVGGSVEVRASVADDLRVIGGDVVLDSSVGGDVFMMGGSLTVSENADIKGDVLVFAGDVKIAGAVGGSIYGSAERLRIDAAVGGDVEIKVNTPLTLGDRANIAGSVTYESRNEMVRSQSSVVEGEMQQREPELLSNGKSVGSALTPLFVLLFSALSLFLLFKPQLQDIAQDVYVHPLITGGIGMAAVLLGPLVALVLILTVLAAPLGMMLAGVLLLFYSVALVVSGIVFGMYGARWLFDITTIELPVIVAGITVLYALLYVPVVGTLVFVVIYFMTIGTLLRFIARKLAA